MDVDKWGLGQTFGEGMLSVMPGVLQSDGWSSICFFFKRKPFFYFTSKLFIHLSYTLRM